MSSSDPEQDGGPDAEHPSTPEPDPLDVDSAFAAIIAGWADAPTTGSWPADEDLTVGRHRRVDDPAGSGADGSDADQDPDAGDQAEVSLSPAGGPFLPSLELPGAERLDEEPEGFVPPEPPPIPRGDVVSRLAWAGLLLGPVLLLVTAFWKGAPEYLMVAAIGGFVGGFVTLVSRMPTHRDDDGDDGAVV